ncbi:ATP-dependent RNA helicase [Corynebacterium cystitidis]|uniref:RNA helicase n=1 Tax=Corynebacterium cystitidis DSM 20524 TaxID=1121357 RepID=A0A1H9U357_9CORY|nr:ATP-dependent RNA helicase [Corynebacterium cystitidis]WJY81147.1 ATP-dependent RNA helicase HrpB [Corynebacterium cystitidis DSM 20524]SES03866.1 ATP-dependent helicase HrpB [Corynebacterium cystitidis DSM 20524]SNV89773.1 ATP-dependent helicase [Corynebacterium cystitidis]
MSFNLDAIGAGLPVAGVIGQLPTQGPLVVEAPPGTGKTTLLPPAISNLTHRGGKVLVTAPRRVAVRAAARRLAQLDRSKLGQRVGYSIRGEHYDGSLVEFVTPAVLLNRLMKDPELTGISAVIVDEVHERQLDTDLVLAMVMEVASLREDLYLAAMSATLDAQALAEHMGAQILSTEAVTHPLEISYHPHEGRSRGTREFYQHVADLAGGVEQRKETGASSNRAASSTSDAREERARTLVFVPGAREVDLVCQALPHAAPLHGRLTSKEQDEALNGDAPVVVSTTIAESSITVPGVHRVVDAGLARVPRRDAARSMQGLVTVSTARSSADQRAGRAGRLGPGTVLRAYSQEDYQHFAPEITPEIATSELTSAALVMAAWGTPRGEGLPLIDEPPTPAIRDAEEVLRALGAVDETGHITDHGTALARMPLDPRLASALVKHGAGAANTVAALAEGVSGDLDRVRAPKSQVDRLKKLVDNKGPVTAGEVVASAFPGWVGKRVGEEYLLAAGTRATLDHSLGALRASEWIAAAEVQLTARGAIIRSAAILGGAPEQRITEETRATLDGGKVRGRKVKAIGAIELSSTPVQLSPAEAAEALSNVGIEHFHFSEKAQALKDRLDFAHEHLGEPWPDVSKGDYTPEVMELAKGASLSAIDMYPALLRQLPWPEASRFDELVPARLSVPSGSSPRISYATERPIVRVKLQECFGLAASPEVCGVRVLFHLLSPAGRELAVTDDLSSFWDGPYQDVRKEMRGRYPKHPWPEDPWTAPATARTKKRM